MSFLMYITKSNTIELKENQRVLRNITLIKYITNDNTKEVLIVNDVIEIFSEVIQKPHVILHRKDLRKVAKEYGITRRNLVKILHKNDYKYDRKAKGYICIRSNANALKIESITSNYNIDKLYEMNMLILDKLNNSNTQINTNTSEVIEADIKLVADFDDTKYKQTSIKVNESIWEEFNRNCKENHKQLDKQELISIALRDFNLKYN